MVESRLISPFKLPPRRTRKNVNQSKHGCYTCKAYHLKCDETLPSCLRCQRSGKQCLGYRDQHGSKPSHVDVDRSSVSLTRLINRSPQNVCAPIRHSILHGFQTTDREARYARLGLEMLFQGRHMTGSWDHNSEWLRLLGQSFLVSNATLKAVIYLGSVCEILLQQITSPSTTDFLRLHNFALIALRKEVPTLQNDPVPVFLASIILAAAAVLLRQLPIALMHMQGAFLMLKYTECPKEQFRADAVCPRGTRKSNDKYSSLYTIALSMDTHTAWYRLSEPPDLPQTVDFQHLCCVVDGMTYIAEEKMDTFLHDCHHFASEASHFKYCSADKIPAHITDTQGRYIAIIQHFLKDTTSSSYKSSPVTVAADYRLLVQRVQSISTLIYLSTILQPYEMAYDSYTDQFVQILDCAEMLMSQYNDIAQSTSLPPFQLQPGIFQPLYFTAVKCRQPLQRRRAVRLFGRIGLEGPWNARMMAAIATRLIEAEEYDKLYHGSDRQLPMVVQEEARIHGCGIDTPSLDIHKFPITIQIHFSRCNDIARMLKEGDFEEPRHWKTWVEEVSVHKYV